MSDLISRSALIKKIKTVADYDWNDTRRKAYKEFLDMLTNAREMSYEHNEKSRLLDAKEIIRIAESEFDGNDMFKIRWLIAHTPTAYDIDKVVRQLNLESVGSSIQVSLGLLRAIEIVKQCGVSDDVCEWRLCDEEANVYDTSCRNPHILIEGTPKENNYEYCPYCGKKIKVVE